MARYKYTPVSRQQKDTIKLWIVVILGLLAIILIVPHLVNGQTRNVQRQGVTKMVLVVQTEEELNALLAAVEVVMDKGEVGNTPDELNFLELVVPQMQAFEQLIYGKPLLCLKCAERINKPDRTKVALEDIRLRQKAQRLQKENFSG